MPDHEISPAALQDIEQIQEFISLDNTEKRLNIWLTVSFAPSNILPNGLEAGMFGIT